MEWHVRDYAAQKGPSSRRCSEMLQRSCCGFIVSTNFRLFWKTPSSKSTRLIFDACDQLVLGPAANSNGGL